MDEIDQSGGCQKGGANRLRPFHICVRETALLLLLSQLLLFFLEQHTPQDLAHHCLG
jgi:hypothetical protein